MQTSNSISTKNNRAITPATSSPAPVAAKSQTAVTPATAPAPQSAKTQAPVATAKSGKTAHPGHEEIAKRAYELYLARGQSSGKEMEDWIQAERELTARTNGRN